MAFDDVDSPALNKLQKFFGGSKQGGTPAVYINKLKEKRDAEPDPKKKAAIQREINAASGSNGD